MSLGTFAKSLLAISILTATPLAFIDGVSHVEAASKTIKVNTYFMNDITYLSLNQFLKLSGFRSQENESALSIVIFNGNQRVAKLVFEDEWGYGKSDAQKIALFSAPLWMDGEWFITPDTVESLLDCKIKSMVSDLLVIELPNANFASGTKPNQTKVPVSTPKPTVKPTMKPTAKPTVKPTPKPASKSANTPALNNAAGKTMIGDSYYGWSMRYPSGLRLARENFTQDSITFEDATTGALIRVISEINEEKPSLRTLMQSLTEDFMDDGEVVIDKKTYDNAPYPYAEVITKSSEGAHYQYRAYPTEEQIFYTLLLIDKKEVAKSATKLRTLQSTFSSFQPKYNNNGKTKDVSTAKNGYRNFKEDRFGYQMDFPADFYKTVEEDTIDFQNDDLTVSLETHSLHEGDTPEAYLSRTIDIFQKTVAEDYRSVLIDEPVTVNGKNGQRQMVSTKIGKDTIVIDCYIFFVGNYYHEISFIYQTDANEQKINNQKNRIIKSLKITKPAGDLGSITDDQDWFLMDQMKTIKNKTFKFSLIMPEITIQKEDSAKGTYQFAVGAGTVNFKIVDESDYRQELKQQEAILKDAAEIFEDFQRLPDQTVIAGGKTGTTQELMFAKDGVQVHDVQTVFYHNQKAYVFSYTAAKTIRSEWFLNEYQSIMERLTFE